MSTVRLDESDNGKSVEVKPGDEIIVELKARSGAGFQWTVDEAGSPVVSVELQSSRASAGSGVGGADIKSFIVKAEQPGTANLRLKLWRDWEGPSSIRERYSLTIKVA